MARHLDFTDLSVTASAELNLDKNLQEKRFEFLEVILKYIILTMTFQCFCPFHLQNQLFLKDQKIKQLESKYGSALKEISQCKIEIASSKSYINSLPTHQEVTKLQVRNILIQIILYSKFLIFFSQKLLLGSEEKRNQLFADLAKLKNKNNSLSDEISSLKQQTCDLKSALETTSSEMKTLRFTVQLWEKRRQAAKLASHVTVEDVLVEKMK